MEKIPYEEQPTEISLNEYRQYDLPVDFIEELHENTKNPLGEDKYIGAFSKAVAKLTKDPDSDLKAVIMRCLYLNENRKGYMRPTYAFAMTLRALQKQFLFNSGLDYKYPDEYSKPKVWIKSINWVLDNRLDDLCDDLSNRELQSNVPQRYVSAHLIAQILQSEGRLPSELNVIDLGCSQNWGLEKLCLGSHFFPLTVLKDKDKALVKDKKATKNINLLIDRKIQINDALGVDIIIPTTKDNILWTESCSRYPSEFLDKKRNKEINILEHENPDNLRFLDADINDNDLVYIPEIKDREFHIGIVSTTLYMQSDENQENIANNLRRIIGKDGVIIYQDFGYLKNNKMKIFKRMFKNPYQYRTIVEDPKAGSVEEYFRFENGRCRTMKLKLGTVVLKKALAS